MGKRLSLLWCHALLLGPLSPCSYPSGSDEFPAVSPSLALELLVMFLQYNSSSAGSCHGRGHFPCQANERTIDAINSPFSSFLGRVEEMLCLKPIY